ncbi:hypothetical protein C0J52_25556 [Blattella germanica]|nr:hypothetical protein C0J52_25556 [Blattella germanica]
MGGYLNIVASQQIPNHHTAEQIISTVSNQHTDEQVITPVSNQQNQDPIVPSVPQSNSTLAQVGQSVVSPAAPFDCNKEDKKRKSTSSPADDKRPIKKKQSDEEKKPQGFDRGLDPERIIGATDSSG